MKQIYKLMLAAVALAMFNTTDALAQKKMPGFLQRLHLGYSILQNSATLKTHQLVITDNFMKDTSYSTDMKTSGSFGFTIGTYVPLKRLGLKSSLNLGVDYMYNMMLWKSKYKSYDGLGNTVDMPFTGGTLQMALPIGLDVKFGCDAVTEKSIRFCATLGAGAFSTYSLTVLDQVSNIGGKFSVAPYVKAEVGVFAGICMKVRAVYAIGSLSYMDVTDKSDYGKASNQLNGTSNLTLSLLIMPFSWSWHRDEWWNTY
jgi:hypothetical protein